MVFGLALLGSRSGRTSFGICIWTRLGAGCDWFVSSLEIGLFGDTAVDQGRVEGILIQFVVRGDIGMWYRFDSSGFAFALVFGTFRMSGRVERWGSARRQDDIGGTRWLGLCRRVGVDCGRRLSL